MEKVFRKCGDATHPRCFLRFAHGEFTVFLPSGCGEFAGVSTGAFFPRIGRARMTRMQKASLENHVRNSSERIIRPEPIASTVTPLDASGLPPETLRMINRGTAERLFPRFKS